MEAQRRLVEERFDVSTSDIREVERGNIVDTYEVYLGGDSYYVQFGYEFPQDQNRGHVVLDELNERDASVPVPEVVEYNEDKSILVTESLGERTLEDTDRESVYKDAGRQLAKVHSISPTSTYGLLAQDEEGLKGTTDNWRSVLHQQYRQFMINTRDFLESDEAAEINRYYHQNIDKVPLNTQKSLLHCDFKPENVVHKDGEVEGIIDWDAAKSGDPDFEYITAKETMKRRGKPVQAFREGYGEERDFDLNQDIEDIYSLHANLNFLSSMMFQKEELDKDITDRNTEFSMKRIDEILSESKKTVHV